MKSCLRARRIWVVDAPLHKARQGPCGASAQKRLRVRQRKNLTKTMMKMTYLLMLIKICLINHNPSVSPRTENNWATGDFFRPQPDFIRPKFKMVKDELIKMAHNTCHRHEVCQENIEILYEYYFCIKEKCTSSKAGAGGTCIY